MSEDKKEILLDFIEWVKNYDGDIFDIFDNPEESVEKYLKENETNENQDLKQEEST